MVKKTMISALLALGSAAASTASEPVDSLPGKTLEEMTVTGNSARQRIDNVRIGAERLELSQLSKLPAFGGENDIIKSISLLPGVRSEGDGGGGFEVFAREGKTIIPDGNTSIRAGDRVIIMAKSIFLQDLNEILREEGAAQ